MNMLIIYYIRRTVHIAVTFLLMTNVMHKHYRFHFFVSSWRTEPRCTISTGYRASNELVRRGNKLQ